MTDGFVTADPAAWQSALVEFKLAEIDYKAVRDTDDTADVVPILLRYSNAERTLLGLGAPDMNAVAEKLMVIFGDDLWEDSEDAQHMCRVIGDLRRLDGLSTGWDGGDD